MKFDILVILFYIFFCGMGAWIGAAVGLSSAAIVCYALGIAEANIAFIVWPCVLFFGLLGLGPAYAVHLIYQFIFDHLLPTLFTVDFHKEQKQD